MREQSLSDVEVGCGTSSPPIQRHQTGVFAPHASAIRGVVLMVPGACAYSYNSLVSESTSSLDARPSATMESPMFSIVIGVNSFTSPSNPAGWMILS